MEENPSTPTARARRDTGAGGLGWLGLLQRLQRGEEGLGELGGGWVKTVSVANVFQDVNRPAMPLHEQVQNSLALQVSPNGLSRKRRPALQIRGGHPLKLLAVEEVCQGSQATCKVFHSGSIWSRASGLWSDTLSSVVLVKSVLTLSSFSRGDSVLFVFELAQVNVLAGNTYLRLPSFVLLFPSHTHAARGIPC